ncbi:MAG: ABC transporter substrate-binding protein [Firmicutes bacterium]|nr:ABC transporter substrate-binding protein [Bacillota bacterium]
MKKLIAMLCAAAMVMMSLAGCAQAGEESSKKSDYVVKVAALKGPTGMGMAKLIEDNTNGTAKNNYEFTMASAADEILANIIKGEFDIAAVPSNVASILYNKTEGKVQMAALNVLGVLYVLSTDDSITSIADLEGKTVYSTGQGAVPEIAFNYILEQNGLTVGEDVMVEYKSEHSELAALMASGEAEIAVLPQPFVTSVLMQNQNVKVVLNLTEEWDKATNGENQMTMGCIVIQQAFAQEHPQELAAFLEEYEASVAYITDEANLENAAALIEKAGIIKAAVAQKALSACNIVYIDGSEMERIASGFLQVLYDSNPAMVGGALPNEDLYYQGDAE